MMCCNVMWGRFFVQVVNGCVDYVVRVLRFDGFRDNVFNIQYFKYCMYWIIGDDIGIFWCCVYDDFVCVVMIFDVVVQSMVFMQRDVDYLMFCLFGCFVDCFRYFFCFIFIEIYVVFLVVNDNQSSKVKVFIVFNGFVDVVDCD